MDNIEREYLKFLQRKVKESKPVAEPKAKQVQVAPSLPKLLPVRHQLQGRGAESQSQRRVLLLLPSKLTI